MWSLATAATGLFTLNASAESAQLDFAKSTSVPMEWTKKPRCGCIVAVVRLKSMPKSEILAEV